MSTVDEESSPEDVVEKERRFLVRDVSVVDGTSWRLITQAYFPAPDGWAVRVRLVQYLHGETWVDETAYLGAKGPRLGGERWEEEFPLKDLSRAKGLISQSEFVVQKRRHSLVDSDATWEVDVFLGENEGLVIAELEGKGEWIWEVAPPRWALREVTHDLQYNNERLAASPIRSWAAGRAADDYDDDVDWLGE